MTEPGGSPGSGWDVSLDLGSVGTPVAGPSGNASPTGDAAGTHARRKSGDFAGMSPRADGAASGSSGSPDENVSARSNPPSPRDRSPRSRSPRPPSPSDEDDPHHAQQHSTPSPVARRSVTPLPFELRRRDALAAKQRRLDGMMGKLSAVRTGREASPAGSVGSAGSSSTAPRNEQRRADDDDDHDAVDHQQPRPPNPREPSRPAREMEEDERRYAQRGSPVGSPVAKPRRADEDATSPTLTDGSASVSDDWDDLLADARRDVFSSPPPKQTKTPTTAAPLATPSTASPWPTVSPADRRGRDPTRNPPVSESSPESIPSASPGDEPSLVITSTSPPRDPRSNETTSTVASPTVTAPTTPYEDDVSNDPSRPEGETDKEKVTATRSSPLSSPLSSSPPLGTRALRVETPSSPPSSRDGDSSFGTPAGETPNGAMTTGGHGRVARERSPLGARRPEARGSGSGSGSGSGFDRDAEFESASPAATFATPRATDESVGGEDFLSDTAEAVRRRAGKPALSDGAASFLARLGAARRGDAADRAQFRRALGVPDEVTTFHAPIRIRGVSDPWLADAAAAANAANAARAAEDSFTPRKPPRSPTVGGSSSPGFVPDTPRTPTGASPRGRESGPTSPAASASPGTPGDARPRPPPHGKAPEISRDRPAAAVLGKAAAARRIMMAASPAKGSPGSMRGASSPGGAVSGVLFGPPVAASPSPARSSSSPGASPSMNKQAAARRIMLAAAAKKASEGVEEDAAAAKVVGASRGGEKNKTSTDASVEPATVSSRAARVSDAETRATGAATKPVAARGLSMELDTIGEEPLGATEAEVSAVPVKPEREVSAVPFNPERVVSVAVVDSERVSSDVARSPAVVSSSTFLGDASSEFAFDAPATSAATGFDPPRSVEPTGLVDPPRPMEPILPNPRGFISDISDTEFDKTDASDWETEDRSSRMDAQLRRLVADADAEVIGSNLAADANETEYETDAGGYGTAAEAFTSANTPRALLVALERAEMRLEEKEWEREAMATRLAEAESALARVESIDGARFAQLQAEAEQNGYLRRLLKRAEETRSEARARAKSARQALVARDAELERFRRRYERDLTRADAEAKGLRRRVAAERARGGALETALAEANAELGAAHRRHLGTFQTLGVALGALVALAMRVYFGPRVGGYARGGVDGAGGGYGGGSSVGFMPRV